MTGSVFLPGARVRARVSLGLIADGRPMEGHFHGTAERGALGTVTDEPDNTLPGWTVVRFDDSPGMYAPVAPDHIEPAP